MNVTIINTTADRTPEQEYKNAERRWKESCTARDATQRHIDVLKKMPWIIYRVFRDWETLSVQATDDQRVTDTQWRVWCYGKLRILDRQSLVDGELVTNGGERFAFGSTILPILQQQLDAQTKAVEVCARRMEEKRQALL